MDLEKDQNLNEKGHEVDIEKLKEEIPELREKENVLGRIARNVAIIYRNAHIQSWNSGSFPFGVNCFM